MLIVWSLIFAFGVYTGQRMLYEKLWDRNLKVKVRFADKVIEAGDKSQVIVVIENRKILPLPIFNLKLTAHRSFIFEDMESASVTDYFYRNEAFSVMGNQRITRKLTFKGSRRGYYEMQSVNTVVKDLFFVKTFAHNYDTGTAIYVLPTKVNNDGLDEFEKSMLGEIESRKSYIEDPFAFRGIRDYTSTDSMSRVNWKATAKTSSLMVNMYNKVAEQRVVIFLNLDEHTPFKCDELREYCISVTSTLARDFVEKGVPVMVKANGLDVITKEMVATEAGSTKDHGVAIDRYLARLMEKLDNNVFIDMLEEAAKDFATNVTYIVVSSNYKDELLHKVDELIGQGMDLHMITPYDYREPMNVSRDYLQGLEVDSDEFYNRNT